LVKSPAAAMQRGFFNGVCNAATVADWLDLIKQLNAISKRQGSVEFARTN
jgi:7,8-dihydro-6-hydroxymethylpterin-pyrophosphokinase